MTDWLFPESLCESVEPLDEGGDHGGRGETYHGVEVGRGLGLAELWSQTPLHGIDLVMRRRQDSIDLLISLRSTSLEKSFDLKGFANQEDRVKWSRVPPELHYFNLRFVRE